MTSGDVITWSYVNDNTAPLTYVHDACWSALIVLLVFSIKIERGKYPDIKTSSWTFSSMRINLMRVEVEYRWTYRSTYMMIIMQYISCVVLSRSGLGRQRHLSWDSSDIEMMARHFLPWTCYRKVHENIVYLSIRRNETWHSLGRSQHWIMVHVKDKAREFENADEFTVDIVIMSDQVTWMYHRDINSSSSRRSIVYLILGDYTTLAFSSVVINEWPSITSTILVSPPHTRIFTTRRYHGMIVWIGCCRWSMMLLTNITMCMFSHQYQ